MTSPRSYGLTPAGGMVVLSVLLFIRKPDWFSPRQRIRNRDRKRCLPDAIPAPERLHSLLITPEPRCK